jgi:hypothetical protein
MISQDLFDEKILSAIDRVTGNSEKESSYELHNVIKTEVCNILLLKIMQLVAEN